MHYVMPVYYQLRFAQLHPNNYICSATKNQFSASQIIKVAA